MLLKDTLVIIILVTLFSHSFSTMVDFIAKSVLSSDKKKEVYTLM